MNRTATTGQTAAAGSGRFTGKTSSMETNAVQYTLSSVCSRENPSSQGAVIGIHEALEVTYFHLCVCVGVCVTETSV